MNLHQAWIKWPRHSLYFTTIPHLYGVQHNVHQLLTLWRKNGTEVQNSTSVRYEMNITEEKNEKYSCEVDRPDGLVKKEISLIVESKFFYNC
ncbi:hypothetical protein OS493_020479 [Desmophyllum pertusum]|uniref:Ig-like domain-containing protein n=1 Tax=Desmophyllum pertusum TaxID=174260 RepID=A0A9W9ZD83_9CNID|nr:hypothetical protein OS493_020479 [Desmophyllum pertusum]